MAPAVVSVFTTPEGYIIVFPGVLSALEIDPTVTVPVPVNEEPSSDKVTTSAAA